MFKFKLTIVLCIFAAAVIDSVYSLNAGGMFMSTYNKSKNKRNATLTVTPGDLCREFLQSETSVWASWSYRCDICTRPLSCRYRESFQVLTRPGKPPEGMLCALYFRGDGDEATKYVCHQGECVRETVPRQ